MNLRKFDRTIDTQISGRESAGGADWKISVRAYKDLLPYKVTIDGWSPGVEPIGVLIYSTNEGAADMLWATKALEFRDRPSHAELVEMLSGITRLIAEDKVSLLAATLKRLLKDQNLRLDVMIAALRGSFPAKPELRGEWRELLTLARQRILDAGRNPESLLRGL